MQTILVTGANGQVGNEFREISKTNKDYHFLFVGKDELPIENFEAVSEYFTNHNINFCINCAAYTAVDKAETEVELAFSVNEIGAKNLAEISFKNNVKFIHISTDYVFDGTANNPYTEQDVTSPSGIYGASKLAGEKSVLQSNPLSIIVRTSWVYSSFGNNFVKTMLRLMASKESIGVVNDQIGCPTYAADLATAIMKIIQNFDAPKTQSIFHFSNEGQISWYEFAMEIKAISNSNCMVNPIPTSAYPTPAKRPAYSVLNTQAIKTTFNIMIPFWKESLKICFHKIIAQ